MSRAPDPPPGRPPRSRLDPHVDHCFGVAVPDPYRWLEGGPPSASASPPSAEVAEWSDAQNAYTRAVLDGIPGRARVEARLRELIEVGTVSLPAVREGRYFHARREGRQDQPVIYWREDHDGEDRALLDPEQMDPTGLTAIEWISPSPNGRTVAYGTYRAGDENTMLRLISVDSGEVLPLEIPNKVHAPDWLPDGSGFVYQNLRDPGDPYSAQIMFHRLGEAVSSDAMLFRQLRPEEDVRLSTTWGPFGSLSRDGRWLVLGYWIDTASNDLWLVDFRRFLETGRVDRVPVTVGDGGQAVGDVIDGTLYLRTTIAAPRGRVVAVAAEAPGKSGWRELVPERDDAVIEAVAAGRSHLVVTYLRHATSVIEVFEPDGTPRGEVRQPGLGTAALGARWDSSEAFLQYTSFDSPPTIYRLDLTRPGADRELWARPDVPIDPAAVEVRQVWYPSADGTRISMFVVGPRGRARTGDAPVLLTGYGGFNISMTPSFAPTLFQWFEAGGLYAVPNLRGGGEYGHAWHEAGMLDRKQDVFDDVIAAGEWLVAEGYTRPERLAIAGGSNGGLLAGAAITQRPDLFRAAIIAVPLLDMLRYEQFLMARYWVPEYGSAEDEAQFRYLRGYSPYHRVRAGVRYPATLLTAGEHDSRVHPMHARKMAAALQAATSANPADRPILLWVDREAGHGQGKPLHLRLRDAVDQRIFVMWQLGVEMPPRED